MENELRYRKQELRKQILARRRSLSDEELTRLSRSAEMKIVGLPEYDHAKTIAIYVAKPDEVQTAYLINRALGYGKKIIVPVVGTADHSLTFSEIRNMDELVKGHFGVMEPKPKLLRPIPLKMAELIIVPVVGWDMKGFRLGYGMGYFDKALSQVKNSFSVGLAFELQRVKSVPHLDFDVRMHALVTEKRTLRFV